MGVIRPAQEPPGTGNRMSAAEAKETGRYLTDDMRLLRVIGVRTGEIQLEDCYTGTLEWMRMSKVLETMRRVVPAE